MVLILPIADDGTRITSPVGQAIIIGVYTVLVVYGLYMMYKLYKM